MPVRSETWFRRNETSLNENRLSSREKIRKFSIYLSLFATTLALFVLIKAEELKNLYKNWISSNREAEAVAIWADDSFEEGDWQSGLRYVATATACRVSQELNKQWCIPFLAKKNSLLMTELSGTELRHTSYDAGGQSIELFSLPEQTQVTEQMQLSEIVFSIEEFPQNIQVVNYQQLQTILRNPTLHGEVQFLWRLSDQNNEGQAPDWGCLQGECINRPALQQGLSNPENVFVGTNHDGEVFIARGSNSLSLDSIDSVARMYWPIDMQADNFFDSLSGFIHSSLTMIAEQSSEPGALIDTLATDASGNVFIVRVLPATLLNHELYHTVLQELRNRGVQEWVIPDTTLSLLNIAPSDSLGLIPSSEDTLVNFAPFNELGEIRSRRTDYLPNLDLALFPRQTGIYFVSTIHSELPQITVQQEDTIQVVTAEAPELEPYRPGEHLLRIPRESIPSQVSRHHFDAALQGLFVSLGYSYESEKIVLSAEYYSRETRSDNLIEFGIYYCEGDMCSAIASMSAYGHGEIQIYNQLEFINSTVFYDPDNIYWPHQFVRAALEEAKKIDHAQISPWAENYNQTYTEEEIFQLYFINPVDWYNYDIPPEILSHLSLNPQEHALFLRDYRAEEFSSFARDLLYLDGSVQRTLLTRFQSTGQSIFLYIFRKHDDGTFSPAYSIQVSGQGEWIANATTSSGWQSQLNLSIDVREHPLSTQRTNTQTIILHREATLFSANDTIPDLAFYQQTLYPDGLPDFSVGRGIALGEFERFAHLYPGIELLSVPPDTHSQSILQIIEDTFPEYTLPDQYSLLFGHTDDNYQLILSDNFSRPIASITVLTRNLQGQTRVLLHTLQPDGIHTFVTNSQLVDSAYYTEEQRSQNIEFIDTVLHHFEALSNERSE